MKVAWRKLLAFTQLADAYLATHPGETKLEYGVKRVRSQIAKHSEHLQERIADIEIDLCVVDDKGVIQRDAQGNLQFTREGLKDRNRKQRELLELEFEVDPHYVSPPSDLTLEQYAAFTGLILHEGTVLEEAGLVGDNGLSVGVS